jgi:phage recombination protein Bet
MAQQATALTVAPRFSKPPEFAGTEIGWRALHECYPNAESPAVLMAVVEYCAVRDLDPYKQPCHVVPMWNSKLRRRVQVIMRGINEIEITAARTKQWAGMELPVWGPPITKTFKGEFENDDGSKRQVSVTLTYPEWCAVTVYRQVGGERAAFSEQLWWIECYGRAGFRSEVPNERWTKAPRQMLHKCVKAAVLRATFPEQGFGYAAEEMEGRETDTGGIVIEGKAETPPAPPTELDRQADAAYPPAEPDEATAGLEGLEEQGGTQWLRNLQGLLAAATTEDRVHAIAGHPSVAHALQAFPATIKAIINEDLRKARERVTAPVPEESPNIPENIPDQEEQTQATAWESDPLQDLFLEIARMDLVDLGNLNTNAAWRAKVRAACEVPPDEDRINEAIEARRVVLKAQEASKQ